MTTPLLVIACKDDACRHTLADALAGLVRIADAPPTEGEWLLVIESPLLAAFDFTHPPCGILALGNAQKNAMPPGTRFDRLPTPFRLQDFVTRLRAMLTCPPPRQLPLLPGCPLKLDVTARRLTGGDDTAPQELTEKETRLLLALLHREGAPIARERLLADVWTYQPEVSTRTLETHLSRLRAKLAAFPDTPSIVAEEGGYRLEAAG